MALVLDLRSNEPYEIAAQLLTAVTYPDLAASRSHVDEGPSPTIRQKSAWICGQELMRAAAVLESDDALWQKRRFRLGYLIPTWDGYHGQHLEFSHRLRERLIAAHMIRVLIEEIQTGRRPTYPEALNVLCLGKRATINKLAQWIVEDPQVWTRYVGSGLSLKVDDPTRVPEPVNIKSRFWRPSLPVLHLATAIAEAAHIFELSRPRPLILEDILHDPAISRAILRRAMALEPTIERLSEFGVRVGRLVRIR